MASKTSDTYSARLVELGNCYIESIDHRMDALQIPDPASKSLATELCDDLAFVRLLAVRLSIRLNRLNSPLLRLPDDVLRIIIADLTATQDDEERTWYRMGHVCNLLRSTLLHMTALWAENVCMLPRKAAVEEFLRRSGDYPIRLEVPCEVMPLLRHNFARRFLERAYRFKTNHPELAWAMYPRFLPSLTEIELSVPPNETAFWMYSQNFSAMTRIDEESLYKIKPEHYNLSLHTLPSLSRLTMTSIHLPICSDSLTELQLSRTFMPTSSSLPSLEQLLLYLQNCPNLEHLRLCGWLPVVIDDSEEEEGELAGNEDPLGDDESVRETLEPNVDPVALVHLRLLELWGDGNRIAALWPYLQIPYTAEVSVRVGYLYDGNKEIIDYLRSLDQSRVLQSIPFLCSHIAAQPPERNVTALCVRADGNRNSRLCLTLYTSREQESLASAHMIDVPRLAFDSSDWPGYIEQAYTPLLRLDICGQQWWSDDAPLAAIHSVSETFQLGSIHALGLQIDADMIEMPNAYGELFDRFPEVNRLELLNPVQVMIEVLSLYQDSTTVQSADSLSVPRHLPLLGELILGVNPDNKPARDKSSDLPSIGEHNEEFNEALVSLAKSRVVDVCSSPLSCIFLRQWNGSEEGIDPDVIEAIRQFIPVENDLEWHCEE